MQEQLIITIMSFFSLILGQAVVFSCPKDRRHISSKVGTGIFISVVVAVSLVVVLFFAKCSADILLSMEWGNVK